MIFYAVADPQRTPALSVQNDESVTLKVLCLKANRLLQNPGQAFVTHKLRNARAFNNLLSNFGFPIRQETPDSLKYMMR